LFTKPILSIQEVAKHFDISYQTAQTLVRQFVNMTILKETTGKRRDRRFSYWEYLECLSEGTNPVEKMD
jgi:transposase